MKNLISLFVAVCIIAISVSCKNEAKTTPPISNEKSANQVINLVGKNLEYNYGDYIYHLNFLTDNKLHWKCVEGDEKGKEADETYFMQNLNNHTYFVSWIEADGLGVSQVINLKDKKINCYLKIDKEIVPLSGTIREL